MSSATGPSPSQQRSEEEEGEEGEEGAGSPGFPGEWRRRGRDGAPPSCPASQAGHGAEGCAATGAVDRSANGGSGKGGAGRRSEPPPFLPVPYIRSQLGLQLATGIPPFTNFTPEFTDTLDYVFIEPGGAGSGDGEGSQGACGGGGAQAPELPGGVDPEGRTSGATDGPLLRVQGVTGAARSGAPGAASAVAPFPEEAPLRALTPGLPTALFPSDHVSLLVDLELASGA